MPWTGSTFIRDNSAFTGPLVWTDDRDAGTKITSAHHDYHDQDLAAGISACINKNGANTPSANISWGNHKITNLGAGTLAADAARYGQTITAASVDPTSKVLTLARDAGDVTVDLTPITVAGDTSDFARKSLANDFTDTNTFAEQTIFFDSFYLSDDTSGYRYIFRQGVSNAPTLTEGMEIYGLDSANGVSLGWGFDGSMDPQVYIGSDRLLKEGDIETGLTAADNNVTITGTGWYFSTPLQIKQPTTVVSAIAGQSWSDQATSGSVRQFVGNVAGSTFVFQGADSGTSAGGNFLVNGHACWNSGTLKISGATPTGGFDGELWIVPTGADRGLWYKSSGSWSKLIPFT